MSRLLLEAIHIQKAFGEQTVLDVDHLSIYDGERIALIGENGAGKSTLLAILAGEAEPDVGQVRHYSSLSIIHQSGDARSSGNARLISEFHAPDHRQGLSGGEMTRRRIAGALSENAPLLLADEPTTDLDADGVDRLTRQLQAYRGALVLVSHDRTLLNTLCTRVLHLEDGKITDFPGSYEDYQAELQRRRDHQQFEYEQYRNEQTRLKALAQQKSEWASSVKKAPKRMGNSEARLHTREYTNSVLAQSAAKRVVQSRMDRLEKKERPRDLPDIRMSLGISSPLEAKTALSVKCDSLAAGDRVLLSNTQFTITAGSRTALMGGNGSGKTTLLRALRDELPPDIRFRGTIRINPGVRMGWFDQDHARALDLDQTALDNARSASQLPESTVRTVLARLNLPGDDVFKPVRVLSGGERAKIALARLLLADSNLLLLDEPTNHLDLFTMEALEELLAGYGGTLLFVSHDRSFVRAIATRILTVKSGCISTFEGTLSQLETEATRNHSFDSVQLQISTLEMQLAALSARMSAPKKGDRPDQLNTEYESISSKLRELKAALRNT